MGLKSGSQGSSLDDEEESDDDEHGHEDPERQSEPDATPTGAGAEAGRERRDGDEPAGGDTGPRDGAPGHPRSTDRDDAGRSVEDTREGPAGGGSSGRSSATSSSSSSASTSPEAPTRQTGPDATRPDDASRPASGPTERAETGRSESGDTRPSLDSIPYKLRREKVNQGRDQVPFFLREAVVDGEDELQDALEAMLGEHVYKSDFREAAMVVAQRNPELVAEVLREWGYDLR